MSLKAESKELLCQCGVIRHKAQSIETNMSKFTILLVIVRCCVGLVAASPLPPSHQLNRSSSVLLKHQLEAMVNTVDKILVDYVRGCASACGKCFSEFFHHQERIIFQASINAARFFVNVKANRLVRSVVQTPLSVREVWSLIPGQVES